MLLKIAAFSGESLARDCACLALCVAVLVSAACSRYVGRYQFPHRYAPTPEELAAFENYALDFSVRPILVEPEEGGALGLDLEIRGDQVYSSANTNVVHTIETDRYVAWNWFFDGMMAKLWLVTPVSVVVAVVAIPVGGITYLFADSGNHYARLVPAEILSMGLYALICNPVSSLCIVLFGGDPVAMRNGSSSFRNPSYVSRALGWTSWFNPFQATLTFGRPVDEHIPGTRTMNELRKPQLPEGAEVSIQFKSAEGEFGEWRAVSRVEEEGGAEAPRWAFTLRKIPELWRVDDAEGIAPGMKARLKLEVASPSGEPVTQVAEFAIPADAQRSSRYSSWKKLRDWNP